MDFGLSTYLFGKERLNSHILEKILQVGVRQIEIMAARHHLDYCDPNQVRDVGQWFADHGVTLHSVHAPVRAGRDRSRADGPRLSIADLEKRQRIESMEEIKRAIEIAERLPFRYLVLHLGVVDEEFDLRKFDAAFSSIEHLRLFARERGVGILLENIPNELSTPERLVHFIDYTHLHDLKVCLDTGHAHLTGDVPTAFHTLKDRIALVHAHDNRREKDDHFAPFDGDINWPQVMSDFRSVEGQFPILLELKDYGPEVTSLERIRQVIERLDALR